MGGNLQVFARSFAQILTQQRKEKKRKEKIREGEGGEGGEGEG